VARDEERVTIIFRGTVAKGKDWENNVKFWMASMETPTYLKGTGFDKEIKVHHGFNSESASRWLIVFRSGDALSTVY
jgi:hypothetical protein